MTRLLLLANPGPEHVGAHLRSAARTLGLPAELLDVRRSWSASRWLNRLAYHFAGKRPTRLRAFGREVEAAVARLRPDLVLVTGIAAPAEATLRAVRQRGARTVNFLTDDPWNKKNGAGFFWAALKEYDAVFSPRRANLADLRRHGCRRVEYLPFGYNPELHFPEPPATAAERERFGCDAAFVGGADADRFPVARALVRAGLKVKLYGGYWERDRELRPCWRGFVQGRELRLAAGGARVNVCLVRRANRDGHAMRSLELPAMGAGLVAEDTGEHRELYGPAGECVEYFTTTEDLVQQTRRLLDHAELARSQAARLHRRICQESAHTYAERLQRLLDRQAWTP